MQGCCHRNKTDVVAGLKIIYMKMQSCKMGVDKPVDVLVDEDENVEMPSQSNVMSIVAYVEVGEWASGHLTLRTDTLFTPAPLNRDRSFYLSI